jgi:ABC-type branched-subunit amino acid transport system ATPase component
VLPGQVHGLIGPNGAGKTTLIDAITGFARTEAGTINLGGRDITGLGPRRRAQLGLSRSFQSLELFDDLSVAENLAVASQAGGARRRLVDLVRPTPVAFGAAGRAAIRNFELETVLDAPPTAISFGRRKVVAIARAVASAPSVLLLDEPAAGLDDTEAEELGALIRQLADDWGVAVLLVEHKVDLIMSTCDTITVMAEGQVLASGPPEEIRAHQQVLDAYLGGVAA